MLSFSATLSRRASAIAASARAIRSFVVDKSHTAASIFSATRAAPRRSKGARAGAACKLGYRSGQCLRGAARANANPMAKSRLCRTRRCMPSGQGRKQLFAGPFIGASPPRGLCRPPACEMAESAQARRCRTEWICRPPPRPAATAATRPRER